VQLLRAADAQRLLIELAGAGDPAGVKTVLGEEAIARAVTLRSTLCVINPGDLADARTTAREIYLAQLRHADHFILAGDASDCAEARIVLARLGVPGTAITLLQDAGPALLDGGRPVHSNDSSRRISS
jgi:G3E family GTPase